MSYNNFLYLLSDALKNNHIELALASLKTFRPVDIADVLTQLSLDQSQLLLTLLPDRAYVFSYLAPNESGESLSAASRRVRRRSKSNSLAASTLICINLAIK